MGLFAVLKGEGSRYDIFQGSGLWTHSFSYVPWNENLQYALDVLFGVVGLYTESELSAYSRLDEDRVVLRYRVGSVDKNFFYHDALETFGNGFYQLGLDQNQYHAVVYDASGKVVRVLYFPQNTSEYPTLIVDEVQGTTLVYDRSRSDSDPSLYRISLYFLTSSGTLLAHCQWAVPGVNPSGILGRKYFIVNGDTGSSICSADGKTLVTGIDRLLGAQTLYRVGLEQSFNIEVADYFVKDGVVYGSDLLPVAKNTVDRAGKLIPGVSYDVEDIPCMAQTDSLAVGVQGNRLAFRTPNDRFVVSIASGERYFTRKGDRLIVTNEGEGHIRAMSLSTGKSLWTIASKYEETVGTVGGILFLHDPQSQTSRAIALATGQTLFAFGSDVVLELSTDYAIVHTGAKYGQPGPGFFILDAEGNVRYQSKSDRAHATHGEFFVLQRGPYLGISDLNGAWVLKALLWNLAHD